MYYYAYASWQQMGSENTIFKTRQNCILFTSRIQSKPFLRPGHIHIHNIFYSKVCKSKNGLDKLLQVTIVLRVINSMFILFFLSILKTT